MSNIIVKNLKTRQILSQCEWPTELASLFRGTQHVSLITENENKFKELDRSFKENENLRLRWAKIAVDEIQDRDPLRIVEYKCLNARDKLATKPDHESDIILVEDVCLKFAALNGLPGPYIKWFLEALGPAGLNKMLAGFDDKSAEAVCTYGMLHQDYMIFCIGSAEGHIVEPRGGSWGWDSIFEHANSGKTYGEMESDTKSKISHRAMAIIKLNEFLAHFKS